MLPVFIFHHSQNFLPHFFKIWQTSEYQD